MNLKQKVVKTGSDFSGVGAFDQALERLGIKQDKKFACDMDKYARQTYILNFGKPEYYPTDVYEREIPKESLDIYMTSPPCQAFSLSGKRLGEKDKRGILFYNSHEFIKVNQPRFFIFENVKGLLSDDKSNKKQKYGKTFTTWLQYLGGKSINGVPNLFPHEEAVNYNIYYKVLNAKNYGIPQNRERVFIVGIRDDKDNTFSWPKEQHLTKRLIDVLEPEVEQKYYLSEKMIKGFISHRERHSEKGNGFGFKPTNGNKIASTITTSAGSRGTDNFIKEGYINQDTQASTVVNENSISQILCAGTHGYANRYVKIKSETRRGRVGKQVAQTLDTGCNQGVLLNYKIRRLTPLECFRLMDFNDSFKWEVSDTQAYKQAGNSICVGVLAGIINKLNL